MIPPLLKTPAKPCFKVARGVQPRAAGTFSPAQICAAYKLPTALPPGGEIAIIELGGGYRHADIKEFFLQNKLPAPSVTDTNLDISNAPGSDADIEVALDIQLAAGVYSVMTGQAAKIRMYWATDIAAAVARIIADRATKVLIAAISISWGAPEIEWGAQLCRQQEAAFAGLAALNLPFFAASGDNDSGDGLATDNVDFPASAPHVVGCGGTTLTANKEVVWNQGGGSGTGGGFSRVFGKQTWQLKAPPAPMGLGRMVPDVSGNADPATGYNIYNDGAWLVVGGTSAVAPLWAGLWAALNPLPAVFMPPWAYLNPAAFRDIVTGSNGTYKAGVGPDPCTGMGSPNGAGLALPIK